MKGDVEEIKHKLDVLPAMILTLGFINWLGAALLVVSVTGYGMGSSGPAR